MFTLKVLLLLFFRVKFTFTFDIQLLNGLYLYDIETSCNKETASIEILRNETVVFLSHLLSDAKIKACLVLQRVHINTLQENVTLEIDQAVFRDNQTYLLLENIENVFFLNKSLAGHVNVIFENCPNVLFYEQSFTEVVSVEIHLYESRLVKSRAFDDFDRFILVDHDSELPNPYDWISNNNNDTSKTIIIAGNLKTTEVISNLYSQYQISERNKCVGIYVPISVFCILIICLAIIGISLIWTKWILESERRLLRWYVANTVGDEDEFIEEHVLLRNGNIVKSGIQISKK